MTSAPYLIAKDEKGIIFSVRRQGMLLPVSSITDSNYT